MTKGCESMRTDRSVRVRGRGLPRPIDGSGSDEVFAAIMAARFAGWRFDRGGRGELGRGRVNRVVRQILSADGRVRRRVSRRRAERRRQKRLGELGAKPAFRAIHIPGRAPLQRCSALDQGVRSDVHRTAEG
jgi:hypothetical protein